MHDKRKINWLYTAASLITCILIWQAVAVYIVGNPFILPSFTDVLLAFILLLGSGTLISDLTMSFLHFAIGIGLALLIGIPTGILMGWFEKMFTFLNPVIEIIRPIPPLAWIPFAIVWFGLTNFSAGFVIFIGAVFPIIINTYTGFSNIPKIFVEAGQMLGCTKNRDLIRFIAFPAAVPHIAAGFRIACGVAWMCLVAAEMFGVSAYGLGHKIWWYYHLHQMTNVLVYMLILGIVGLAVDALFRFYIRRSLLRWQTGEVH
ncbi:MAG: ABC transporter permease [Methanospirillaceae archaeon]|nr:ABC transporter permease [Methanospirillaceae archaeon]